jgi:hypothetical protein
MSLNINLDSKLIQKNIFDLPIEFNKLLNKSQ